MATSAGIPESLKAIRPFMVVAKEHERRDPIISYYCRRYAVEISVKMKDRPKDATQFLFNLMDQLETQKKELMVTSSEAITSDVVASAHMDNCATKLFLWADTEDRRGNANKSVVKSFHTASILFDAMQMFGDLTEEVSQNRKYAKWKATYIHGCLKRGETPVPGPVGGMEEGAEGGAPLPHPSSLQPGPPPPTVQHPGYPPAAGAYPPGAYPPGAYPPGTYPSAAPGASAYPPVPAQQPSVNQLAPGVPQGQHAPPSTPDQGGAYQAGMPGPSANTSGSVQLSPEDYAKAMKLCKFAGSALQYEDVPTAIDNLEKALRLLKTGRE